MRYDDVLNHFGGLTKTAKALDLSKQTIHSWKDRGVIPFTQQFRIQLKTKGRLKASLAQLEKRGRAA